MPALQAQGEGCDVFVVTDASGGVSVEAHAMGVERTILARIKPITWLAVLCEWQRDWARTDKLGSLPGILQAHGGASGVAFDWKAQLLGAAGKNG
jgi:hypothetical protein